jgi:hypothetical protein
VELGEDSKHAVKGVTEASLQLDSGNPISIKYVIFVQGLKKNLMFIFALEDKGFRVAFVDGQVLICNFVAATKITRRNTMHKYTRSILGNPSQQGKKTQPILCYILQEKDLQHQENLAHKRVLANPTKLAPKRRAHLSKKDVLAEISKLTQKM